MQRLWISVAALIVDQVSKWLVASRLEPWSSVPVLGDFFRLTFIYNSGAVFGLRIGSAWVHMILSLIAMAVVVWMLYQTPAEDAMTTLGLTLVLGGAAGNLFDRLEFVQTTGGAVVDFLDLGIGTYRWYIFNVADACVTIGVGFLLFSHGLSSRSHADHASGSEDC